MFVRLWEKVFWKFIEKVLTTLKFLGILENLTLIEFLVLKIFESFLIFSNFAELFEFSFISSGFLKVKGHP